MPACLTHNLFAKKVLAALPEKEGLNECAYFWGAQGPDFLFCHRYFPWMGDGFLQAYGSKLHAMDPVETLGALREYLAAHDDPAYRSYVWGLLCHYSLDSLAHPYVNALAHKLAEERPWETPGTMHGEIESALDAIILRRESGKLPSEVRLGEMFPKNESVQRRIAKLYKDWIFRTTGDDMPEDAIYQSTADAHLIFTCLTDRSGLKKHLFDIIEKGKKSSISSHIVPLVEREDVDYANVREEEWTAGGETCSKSFFDLFEEAQALAHTLITGFAGCDLAAVTKGRPFG